jgi:hypothetical protein
MNEENPMQAHFPDLNAQLDGLKIRFDKPVDRPMRLTGKCREAFEKWLSMSNYRFLTVEQFENFYTQSMQFGVLVDFFDNVGIKVSTIPTMFVDDWGCDVFGWDGCLLLGLKTRHEARIKAIKKANEIFLKNSI